MTSVGDKEGIKWANPNYTGQQFVVKAGSRYKNYAGSQASLKVGKLCKVNIWDKSGKFKTFLPGEYPDIRSEIPNVDITQAIDIQFKFSIDIKFVHTIQGKPENAYELTVKPLQFENTVIPSGGEYVGVQIPELNPPDSLIVTQISAREKEWPHQIQMNGSIYFKYNPANNTLSYEKTEGFPQNADIKQDDVSGFTITLKSPLS